MKKLYRVLVVDGDGWTQHECYLNLYEFEDEVDGKIISEFCDLHWNENRRECEAWLKNNAQRLPNNLNFDEIDFVKVYFG